MSGLPTTREGIVETLQESTCTESFRRLFSNEFEALPISQNDATSHVAEHLPWGTPHHGDIYHTVRLLIDQDKITGINSICYVFN